MSSKAYRSLSKSCNTKPTSGIEVLLAETVEDFKSIFKAIKRVMDNFVEKIVDLDDSIMKNAFGHSESLKILKQESQFRNRRAIEQLGYETEQKPAADLDVQLDSNTRVTVLYDDLAHRANSWLLVKDSHDTQSYPRANKMRSNDIDDLMDGRYDYPAYESMECLTDAELNEALGKFGLDVVACQELTEKEKLCLLRSEIGAYMC